MLVLLRISFTIDIWCEKNDPKTDICLGFTNKTGAEGAEKISPYLGYELNFSKFSSYPKFLQRKPFPINPPL